MKLLGRKEIIIKIFQQKIKLSRKATIEALQIERYTSWDKKIEPL